MYSVWKIIALNRVRRGNAGGRTVRRTSSPSTVVEDRSRIRDVVHVKDRLHVAICEPVEVDDDGGIFGRQWINNTEHIFVR